MSQRDVNKGRALELLNSLGGTHHTATWLAIIAKAVAFLLARYIEEQDE